MRSLSEATWADIEALREQVLRASERPRLVQAASELCRLFVEQFDSIVLARVFAVLPLAALPQAERSFAKRLTGDAGGLTDATKILSLLGTRGREAAWNERLSSESHLAIPLLNATSVRAAPMVAKLLSDLDVDLQALDDGRPIVTRQMLGGRNGVFYVPEAASSVDSAGRHIVPAHDFVAKHGIRTVFGMGGAYVDGTLAVMVVFCDEALERAVVDRFASFISSFKMATAALQAEESIF
jgi:hypothetical protein